MRIALPLQKSEGDHWITIHPHGKGEDADYRRIKIDASGNIVGGSVPQEMHGRNIKTAFQKRKLEQPPMSKHLNEIGVKHQMILHPGDKQYGYKIGDGLQDAKDKFGRPTAKRGTIAFEDWRKMPRLGSGDWARIASNFDDKDKIKALGARFDGDTKGWWIPLKNIPQVAKYFDHVSIHNGIASAYDQLHGHSGVYATEEEMAHAREVQQKAREEQQKAREEQQKAREEQQKARDEQLKQEKEKRDALDRDKYQGMSAKQIREDVEKDWPSWRRELMQFAGRLEHDSMGSGYSMRGRVDRDIFNEARRAGAIFLSDDDGWLIVPPRYPEPYYEAVKREAEHKAAEKQARLNYVREFDSHATVPPAPDGQQLPYPQGDTVVVTPQSIYGRGQEFVIDKSDGKIWNIKRNGSDGDDWSLNNIRTGGAGAIGSYIPYTAEAADHIKELFGKDKLEKSVAAGKSLRRSRRDWRELSRVKLDRYGSDETYADTAHHSYPLTKHGKPSRERTLAAWRYIHTAKDGDEYSARERRQIEARIKRFAHRHFNKVLKKSYVVMFKIRA